MFVLFAACANDPVVVPDVSVPDEEIDEAAATAEWFYDPDRVVEIVVELDPADAEALAAQTNDLFQLLEGEDCLAEPWKGPFTWFEATVTVEGERFERAGVRKKGLIGSMSSDKPSVKIDL